MWDSAWITYGGLASGIVGAVGSILAWWRVGQVKSLDLRIELAKAEVEINAIVKDLPEFLELSRRSRERITAATGQSGVFQGWIEQWNTDFKTVQSFSAWLPPVNQKISKLSQTELEAKLINAVRLQTQARLLKEKYTVEIAADDKERDNIRTDVRSSTHAKLLQTKT